MIEIRPYQMDLYNRVKEERRNGKRIIVAQAPTGSGKTTWACYLCERAVEKNCATLFLVHRRRLVDQISDRLRQFNIEHGVILAPRSASIYTRSFLSKMCVTGSPWLSNTLNKSLNISKTIARQSFVSARARDAGNASCLGCSQDE